MRRRVMSMRKYMAISAVLSDDEHKQSFREKSLTEQNKALQTMGSSRRSLQPCLQQQQEDTVASPHHKGLSVIEGKTLPVSQTLEVLITKMFSRILSEGQNVLWPTVC